MVLILYHECHYFSYKPSLNLNCLTPRKTKITFFCGLREYTKCKISAHIQLTCLLMLSLY